MQTGPPDLPDAVVAAGVSDGWKLPAATAVYRPVGYGSHHWSVHDAAGGRWFASVDVFAEGDIRAPDGSVLRRLPGGYALALYPYVTGRSGGFHDPLASTDATELIGRRCSLHAASVGVLAPGGYVQLAFQVGDEVSHRTEAGGHEVSLDFHRRRPDQVAELLSQAGFAVCARMLREPDGYGDFPEQTPQGFVLARKPTHTDRP